jgi:hypothetical protein
MLPNVLRRSYFGPTRTEPMYTFVAPTSIDKIHTNTQELLRYYYHPYDRTKAYQQEQIFLDVRYRRSRQGAWTLYTHIVSIGTHSVEARDL